MSNKSQKDFAIIPVVIVIAVLAAGGYWYWHSKPSKNEKHESFKTYTECVKDTKLPCKHYFVGDLGQEWRPSPYLSKKECDDAERVVGFTCVVPPGSFRETRWINGADLETANRESGTLNWKTYRNEQYGFEVRYPPSWINNPDLAELLALPSNTVRIGFGIDLTHVTIGVTIVSSTRSDLKNSGLLLDPVQREENISVDGVSAVKYTTRNSGTGTSCTEVIVKRQNTYGITNCDDQFTVTFNQILSTFKFLK